MKTLENSNDRECKAYDMKTRRLEALALCLSALDNAENSTFNDAQNTIVNIIKSIGNTVGNVE